MKAAALSNLKKVTLELGGKSPNIIFASADLDQAAAWSAMGGPSGSLRLLLSLYVLLTGCHAAVFYNSGQDCCAGTRLLVQDSCYDEFMPKLIAHAKACAIGDVS